ncbi:hypothetical protein GBA52_022007 [Prunus armeniaca]|nr:hypothetical protein GBA52_022007 [Prunus armeniaca]
MAPPLTISLSLQLHGDRHHSSFPSRHHSSLGSLPHCTFRKRTKPASLRDVTRNRPRLLPQTHPPRESFKDSTMFMSTLTTLSLSNLIPARLPSTAINNGCEAQLRTNDRDQRPQIHLPRNQRPSSTGSKPSDRRTSTSPSTLAIGASSSDPTAPAKPRS